MLLNCDVGEDSWESHGRQGVPTSQSERKSVLGVHWKDWCWSWNSNALATWWEELTHWKRPWSWERLNVRGEGHDRGWDGWMTSPTQWTWVWVNSELVIDRKAWRAAVHRVAKSRTRLSNWTELNWTVTGSTPFFVTSLPFTLYIHFNLTLEVSVCVWVCVSWGRVWGKRTSSQFLLLCQWFPPTNQCIFLCICKNWHS